MTFVTERATYCASSQDTPCALPPTRLVYFRGDRPLQSGLPEGLNGKTTVSYVRRAVFIAF
jgi:hypothetical protein